MAINALQEAYSFRQDEQWCQAIAAMLPSLNSTALLFNAKLDNIHRDAMHVASDVSQAIILGNSVSNVQYDALTAVSLSTQVVTPVLSHATLPLTIDEISMVAGWISQHPSAVIALTSSSPVVLLLAILHQTVWRSSVWWHLDEAPLAEEIKSWLPYINAHWCITSCHSFATQLPISRIVPAVMRKADCLYLAKQLQHNSAKKPDASLLYPICVSAWQLAQDVDVAEPPSRNEPQQVLAKKAASGYQLNIDYIDSQSVTGWAISLAEPASVFSITLELDGNAAITVENTLVRNDLLRAGISNGLGGFKFVIPAALSALRSYRLRLLLPDGSTSDVMSLPASGLPVAKTLANSKVNRVSIIVPIFNAAADLQRCLNTLQQFTYGNVRLILIDDASTSADVSVILAKISDWPNCVILQNEQNLGFTKTVNRGIAAAGTDDVVLLNSDARVTPNWLSLLQQAAYSASDIATVTPLSDRAGAFSAPTIGNDNPLPNGVEEAEYAIALQRESSLFYPEVPTGNGFCLYIRRACIDVIGVLDEQAFPRGYGEENDFCMRARLAGWRSIIADNCYVFHQRSQSFQQEKHELMLSGRRVIDKRYPDYTKAIGVFTAPVMQLIRFQARNALDYVNSKPVQPRLLFVLSTQTGGTPQTNRDLMRALGHDADCWLLRCTESDLFLWQQIDGQEHQRFYHKLQQPVDPLTHRSAEYDAVVGHWLNILRCNVVHIRHLAWHSVNLAALAKAAGSAVVLSFHDFYMLCPTVQLIDAQQRYCAGKCTQEGTADCQPQLWPKESFPPLRNHWVFQWRNLFTPLLEQCDAYITTSASAKDTICKVLPQIANRPFATIAHGRDFTELSQLSRAPVPGGVLKILLPGNITQSKGLHLVEQLLAIDHALRLEFHILGQHKFASSDPRLVFHGVYERKDFNTKVRQIRPHIGAVLSVWDETWCHTLTELWSAGLPVAVLPFGTVANRVKQHGAGWVLSEQINLLYDALLNIADESVLYQTAVTAVVNWQQTEARYNTTQYMATRYQQVYRFANEKTQIAKRSFVMASVTSEVEIDKLPVALVCPQLSSTLANPSTHIRIWLRTTFKLTGQNSFVRFTPSQLIEAVKAGQICNAVIQRTVFSATEWHEFKALVKQDKVRYLFDIDDDLFAVPSEKDKLGYYQQYCEILTDIIQHATWVTAASKVLVERLTSINPQVTLLPNALSSDLWRGAITPVKAPDNFTLLYMGSPSHDDDFNLVRPAFEAFAATHPDFKLKVIGVFSNEASTPDWMVRIPIPDTHSHYPQFVKWLKQQCSDCSAAIAPLCDTRFNQAKSALKLLDSGALGLAVLASDCIVYRQSTAPGLTLVKSTDWQLALEHAYQNKDELHTAGLLMQQWVNTSQLLTHQHAFDSYMRLLEHCATS